MESVKSLFTLNTPLYFDPNEENDLTTYLQKELEQYYVVVVDGQVKGSGGINFSADKTIASLSWDLIHPMFQGKSMGKQLVQFRLQQIHLIPTITDIQVRTSQHAFKFYEKQGFRLKNIEKDYWAPGYDLYLMKLPEQETGIYF